MKSYQTPSSVGIKVIVVTGEGIGVDLVVMIINIGGLQGAHHHIEVGGIFHQGTLPTVEDIGGTCLGHHLLIPNMVAQIGGMLVGLGDILH